MRVRWRRALGLLLLPMLLAGCAAPSLVKTVTTVKPTATTAPLGCPVWTRTPQSVTTPSGTSASAVAAANAAAVLSTVRPVRNLYAITQHLVKHLATPIDCRVRSQPRDEHVGDVRQFWVVTSSQSGYRKLSARLVYETAHLYMYVEAGVPYDEDSIRASADTFERKTYAADRDYFGTQWLPGPDDDAHITVLNATNLGPIGGYFSSEDEYPVAVSPYSNERQMIYINLDGGEVPGTNTYQSTLAHEFQHMIHWYQHPGDSSWANEGMSVLAEHLNGFTDYGVAEAFLDSPDTQLDDWTDDAEANLAHYGAGFLFMDYFAEHYGGASVLRELLSSPLQVPQNFDAVLEKHGYTDRFTDVFARFVMANLLDDSSVAGGAYGYPSLSGIQATPQASVQSYPYSAADATVHQYAADYYDFTPSGASGTLTLDFKGTATVPIVSNTPYGGAADEWWSNSGDEMDTTLTRPLDLSKVAAGSPVQMSFQAWYDLEPDFDYAYVEVSTDGGTNWTALPTNVSTDANPNGGNVGNGITGVSGGGSSPVWVPVTVDLSAYAGKQVQLRFESITDDAVHHPGFTLDALRIPAIGYSDNMATDNGWQANGWIRSNNTLPEQYVLQAAVYHSGQAAPDVQRITVDAAKGTASVQWPSFGGTVTHVTVAVTALAPTTVVPARYTLTARLG